MMMSEEEYFFYEWLIVSKNMSKEEFCRLSMSEMNQLHAEFTSLLRGAK